MSELTVATRYAKSLIDLAQEQKALEPVKADMELFVNTLKASTELQAVLRNPIVAHGKKKSILHAIFGEKVSKVTISFFDIMVSKARAEILYPTALEFVSQYNFINKIINAKVVSASPLSAANLEVIKAEVARITGGSVALQSKVDPNLIGGFVLTVGDRQIDTSVATGLNAIKKEFAQRVTK
ncbi:ATP synthase F1 subunit delta [Mucilaginibacter myungsuensis]|uniref:ATP synthase subunit delta n=1 Tax=Mucilaginibacter myungsuensis TaxID=649104 RepID=A0A929L0G8_9SPHI|nr:ATP synthase F1 subunit delta [Mucilaginibacter myungsuensis]MBE9663970.1 ATP synthase F1 subunit delta [Mucilaginibacter myungsuensis]MDN3598314.1 ATP synthase F1 subunit delta [Mucilaginibacter myungsuensis]